jgi:hypothetical protein
VPQPGIRVRHDATWRTCGLADSQRMARSNKLKQRPCNAMGKRGVIVPTTCHHRCTIFSTPSMGTSCEAFQNGVWWGSGMSSLDFTYLSSPTLRYLYLRLGLDTASTSRRTVRGIRRLIIYQIRSNPILSRHCIVHVLSRGRPLDNGQNTYARHLKPWIISRYH